MLATAPLIDELHETTLDLFASDDKGEIAAKVLAAACRLIAAETASVWVPDGDEFECRGAIGEGGNGLTGARIAAATAAGRLEGEEGQAILAVKITVQGRLAALLRVSRAGGRTSPGRTSPGRTSPEAAANFTEAEQQLLRHLAESAGAAMESATRLASSERAAADGARDLGLITEMSREIVSTLDLDRVLRSVVNLASRMFSFDRGAIALYERGACDIRAVAGADGIQPKDPSLQDLALRAAWAAGRGEHFYLSDRADPASDAERIFAHIFGVDLDRDGAMSGLYLPLKDEEGIVGILLFEAQRTDLATPRQRELALILANQATVAVRNARLYHQIPLADVQGAIARRKEALLAIPRHRRIAYTAAALITVASATLIQWPLRVIGNDPVFQPLWRAEVRPALSGIVDRVFVREGGPVARGDPIAHLRDEELRAQHAAAVAGVAAAEREAAMAASRGDAAEERLQRLRVEVFRREAEILDEQVRSALVRSPVGGMVLTARPEDRVGTHIEAGGLLAIVGRTDSLELELGVEQKDVTRVRVGDEVRVRVTALPQRTFSGRVVSIGALSAERAGGVWFPVRAVIANPDTLLRPGMAAYARVLTARASLFGRLGRSPARAFRLFWWRIWR